MAKKRQPNWQRGVPKPPSGEPQPIRPGSSGTADIDFGAARTVDSTWDPGQPQRANYVPLPPPPERARRTFSVSASWISVILVALGLIGSAIAYIGGMKGDLAVAGAKIEALQKSQDSWIANVRADIQRVETSLDAKLNHLSDLIQARRPLPETERPVPRK